VKVTKKTFCRHIRYIGQSDIGDKSRNTLIRSCLDIGTSVNIGKFLSEMGFGYVCSLGLLLYVCVVQIPIVAVLHCVTFS